MADKLHRQLAHPPFVKLIDLVEKVGRGDKDLCDAMKEVLKMCGVCAKLKKPSPRPALSIQFASKFKDAISMDLNCWGPEYFFGHCRLCDAFCHCYSDGY